MDFALNFICAGTEFSTLTKHVPAPYFRKAFALGKAPVAASILICGLGFYELYVNGERMTKGALAPYISNPDDILYYDRVDVTDVLKTGENVIAVCLGNGLLNNPGGFIWQFDKASYRAAPQFAMRLEADLGDGGESFSIESDESFKTSCSPTIFDDLRQGEHYDARLEQPGWNTAGFDDSSWDDAVRAMPPRGQKRICHAEPIVITNELKPVSVKQIPGGYLYDFGVNAAGVCRLKISGKAGQKLILEHGELLLDGCLTMRNITFNKDDYIVQTFEYTCRDGEQTWTPMFTFSGFQYVFVSGMTPEQATSDALTYLVMNSDLKERGGFSCSDDTVNTLQVLTRRSTLANFYYFPMDCPHREKNGWTGDAAMSAEHILLNLEVEHSFSEWLHNIRAAQDERGSIPSVVPTAGYGRGGSGPAWDCVIVDLPYTTYVYRGDKTILKENSHAIFRYIEFLADCAAQDGLIHHGLGDWCPAGRIFNQYKPPVDLTSTIYAVDSCKKAAYIYDELGLLLQRDFAVALAVKMRAAVREQLIDLKTMTAAGSCQTSQAMAIFYDIFEPAEKTAALEVLLRQIKQTDGHLDVGILGARVLFHVLADFGHTDLALEMIRRPDFPSYGWWVAQGATALWEDMEGILDSPKVGSKNHHFWGDISHFFIRHLAGINYSRRGLDIFPKFVCALDYAEAFHIAPEGEIRVHWRRQLKENSSGSGDAAGEILLCITAPDALSGAIHVPEGFAFEDGLSQKPLKSGDYIIISTSGK